MRKVDSKEFKKAMINVDVDSFAQLAKMTEIHCTTLSNVVNNEQKPSYDTIAQLADTFHLTYEEIGRIFFSQELAQTQV